MSEDITICHEAKDIPCVLSLPEATNQDSDCGLILTHGAGGDLHTKQLKDITDRMVTKGWTVLRFTCRGHMNHRAKVFGTVLKWFSEQNSPLKHIFIGGRSMGARAACMAARDPSADTLNIDEDLQSKTSQHAHNSLRGVVCLAYPLHPPTDSHNLRLQPLIDLRRPAVFVSGTKDTFAKKELMESNLNSHCADLATLHWIDGADHSHKVRGKPDNDVIAEICDVIQKWSKDIIQQIPTKDATACNDSEKKLLSEIAQDSEKKPLQEIASVAFDSELGDAKERDSKIKGKGLSMKRAGRPRNENEVNGGIITKRKSRK